MDGKPCDGKLSRTVWGGGKLGGMAIRSMYPMCFDIIPAGDCLPDFLEMGSL